MYSMHCCPYRVESFQAESCCLTSDTLHATVMLASQQRKMA